MISPVVDPTAPGGPRSSTCLTLSRVSGPQSFRLNQRLVEFGCFVDFENRSLRLPGFLSVDSQLFMDQLRGGLVFYGQISGSCVFSQI